MIPDTKAKTFRLAFALLIPSMAMSMVNVILPQITAETGMSIYRSNWIQLSYLLTLTCTVLLAGAIGDQYGQQKTLKIGLAGIGFTALGCALSTTIPLLALFRALQGFAAALLVTQIWAMAKHLNDNKKTGSAMGLLASAAATGTALGPVIAGLLTSFLPWQAIFALLAGLAAISYLLCLKPLQVDYTSGKTRERSINWRCHLLIISVCIGIALFSSGYLKIQGLLLTFVCLLLLVLLNSRTIRLWPKKLSTAPVFIPVLLGNFLVDAIAMSTLIIGSYYLTWGLKLPAFYIGLVLATGPITSAIFGLPAGKWVDSKGADFVLLTGLYLFCSGTMALAILPQHINLTGYVLPLVVMAIGRQLYLAASYTNLMNATTADKTGATSGLLNFIKHAALFFGTAFSGMSFNFQLQNTAINSASKALLDNAFFTTFLIAVAPLITVGLLILTIQTMKNK